MIQTRKRPSTNPGPTSERVGLFTASQVHFRKAGGRNLDNLTVATAIFDANGNFVVGAQKTLEMKLEDANVPETVAGRFDGQIEL
jgi:hypothetical protein